MTGNPKPSPPEFSSGSSAGHRVTRITYQGSCPTGGTIDDWLAKRDSCYQSVVPRHKQGSAHDEYNTLKSPVRGANTAAKDGAKAAAKALGAPGAANRILTATGEIVRVQDLKQNEDGHIVTSSSTPANLRLLDDLKSIVSSELAAGISFQRGLMQDGAEEGRCTQQTDNKATKLPGKASRSSSLRVPDSVSLQVRPHFCNHRLALGISNISLNYALRCYI